MTAFRVLAPLAVSIPRLATPRLLLREAREADFPEFAENAADAPARVHVGGRLDARDAFRRFLAMGGHWALQGMGWWMVEEPASGHVVGFVGVFRREIAPDAEIGWTTYRAHWGKGFAAEAARAALEYTMETHRPPRVIAHIAKTNEPSMKVAEKIGMRREGEASFYGEPDWLYAYEP